MSWGPLAASEFLVILILIAGFLVYYFYGTPSAATCDENTIVQAALDKKIEDSWFTGTQARNNLKTFVTAHSSTYCPASTGSGSGSGSTATCPTCETCTVCNPPAILRVGKYTYSNNGKAFMSSPPYTMWFKEGFLETDWNRTGAYVDVTGGKHGKGSIFSVELTDQGLLNFADEQGKPLGSLGTANHPSATGTNYSLTYAQDATDGTLLIRDAIGFTTWRGRLADLVVPE